MQLRFGLPGRIALPAPPEEPRISSPRVEPSPAEATARHATQAMAATPLAGGMVGGLAGAAVEAPFPRGFNTEAYDRINDNQWTRRPTARCRRFPSTSTPRRTRTSAASSTTAGAAHRRGPHRGADQLLPLRLPGAARRRSRSRSRPTIGACPWNPEHRLALIGLQARRIDAEPHPAAQPRVPDRRVGLDDRPDKLPLVKASLRDAGAERSPPRTASPSSSTPATPAWCCRRRPASDTPTILDALDRARGRRLDQRRRGHPARLRGGAGALHQGRRQPRHPRDRRRLQRRRHRSGRRCSRLIEEKRESGVFLSVLGFGMGNLKDSTMEKLADTGNGNYAYIDSLDEARKVLVEQAGGTLVTVAKDVKLQVEFNPRARRRVPADRLREPAARRHEDFNDDKKDAGEIGAGHSVTALYEIVPAGAGRRHAVGRSAEVPAADAAVGARPRRDEADDGQDPLQGSPTATTSTLHRPSPCADRNDDDRRRLGFAAAVAEFGMLLRDSEFKGSSSFAEALALAERFKGEDAHGHRAEFIRLIGAAEGVSRITHRPTAVRE